MFNSIKRFKKIPGGFIWWWFKKKISRGYKLSENIKNIYNKKPLYFFEKKFSLQEIENIFSEKKIRSYSYIKKK